MSCKSHHDGSRGMEIGHQIEHQRNKETRMLRLLGCSLPVTSAWEHTLSGTE